MGAADAREDSSLFVYGSLLDRAHPAALLGREVGAAAARLDGYQRRRGRYFYIVAHAGAATDGLLLSGLGERDFAVLDRYEDVPRLYTRERIAVADAGGATLRCWVYLPAPALLRCAG